MEKLDEARRIKDIEDCEQMYGRKVITPRFYLKRDDKGDFIMSKDEWMVKARCVCDCGAEVKLKSHPQHKKSKKHEEYLDKIQSENEG
jgi:hypothetical protein